VYFDRAEVPVSSTEIREWATAHWEYIPEVCRDHYVRKVLVVGGESTGKSTLVENLALAYNTNFVREIGRDTCEYAGGEEFMVEDDLVENFIRQKDEVRRAARYSNRLLFVDTDALTTGFYCDLLMDDDEQKRRLTDMADAINATNEWDLVLFLDPDGTDFVQDGTRNEDIMRERRHYSDLLKAWFDRHGVHCETISGDYLDRFNTAKKLIEERLAITTVF